LGTSASFSYLPDDDEIRRYLAIKRGKKQSAYKDYVLSEDEKGVTLKNFKKLNRKDLLLIEEQSEMPQSLVSLSSFSQFVKMVLTNIEQSTQHSNISVMIKILRPLFHSLQKSNSTCSSKI